ncbi:hypothetical protein CAPTEDRAFT_188663 [Capitella teleta]|uniref:EGF-like domain-containing protein n=1 Tax=Capitella teleta TaxID=283909 RepID=R7UZY1_CAPTE|nr:hypothetical protein CAPTEDRAFT_188663 [Capitella teleta]|eukprot:ELU11854.1 hypothetical protein CAPTEDRAFT_188663 [Capitella teleta]
MIQQSIILQMEQFTDKFGEETMDNYPSSVSGVKYVNLFHVTLVAISIFFWGHFRNRGFSEEVKLELEAAYNSGLTSWESPTKKRKLEEIQNKHEGLTMLKIKGHGDAMTEISRRWPEARQDKKLCAALQESAEAAMAKPLTTQMKESEFDEIESLGGQAIFFLVRGDKTYIYVTKDLVKAPIFAPNIEKSSTDLLNHCSDESDGDDSNMAARIRSSGWSSTVLFVGLSVFALVFNLVDAERQKMCSIDEIRSGGPRRGNICVNIAELLSVVCGGINRRDPDARSSGGHRGSLCQYQTYCLNGGTCWEGLLGKICECQAGYRGSRCEENDLSYLVNQHFRPTNNLYMSGDSAYWPGALALSRSERGDGYYMGRLNGFVRVV